MTNEERDLELLRQAASLHGVEPDLLLRLLSLAEESSAVSTYGSKADFSRQVTAVLDAAAESWSGS